MASMNCCILFFFFFFLVLNFTLFSHCSSGARTPSDLAEEQPALTYHKGVLLTGPISVNLIWYGNFTSAQRSVVSDFVASLSASGGHQDSPSVSAWWKTMERYYYSQSGTEAPRLALGEQILDESCSLGESLEAADIAKLAGKGRRSRSINVVLTSEDVAVDRFCRSRCGTHGSTSSGSVRSAYVWVGNPSAQCPGYCAWPFHQPAYGPQSAPLAAPNGDVGADGMVVNLAGLLAGTVTNPFGSGFFQGPKEAPLEAASACPGIYGKGAYPGYAGDLLVDPASGASYNVNGAHGRRYLVPALFDPATASCSTMV